MGYWRRKGDGCDYHQRKPPIGGSSNWHQKVPYWEKRFVSTVGPLPWKRFLETKEFTHLYDNIMKWDDSAAEAAFRTAKARFYAEFHGLPCDADLQNPDLYIDNIDWNAQVDYNLIQELESEPAAPDDADQHDPVVIFDDVLPDPYKDYSPYGWGDSDDKIKKSWGVNDEVKNDRNGVNWDDYIVNGKIIWDDCDVKGGNGWWDSNENDNKAGDQGWNTQSYDENNYFVNNDRRSRSWRNRGNGRKSTGQWSTDQARGSQRVHAHP